MKKYFIALIMILFSIILLLLAKFDPDIIFDAINGIFDNNFILQHVLFCTMLFLLLLICCLYIKNYKPEYKKIIVPVIFATAFFISSIFILKSDLNIFGVIKTRCAKTLIGLIDEKKVYEIDEYRELSNQVMYSEYFYNKSLVVDESVNLNESGNIFVSEWGLPLKRITRTSVQFEIDNRIFYELCEGMHYNLFYDTYLFVDKDICNSNYIYGCRFENKTLFVSEALYKAIINGTYKSLISKSDNNVNNPYKYLYELDRSSNDLILQIFVLFIILFIGMPFAMLFTKNEKGIVSVVAFPTGIGVICTLGLLFIVTDLAFNVIIFSGCIIACFVVGVFLVIKKNYSLSFPYLINLTSVYTIVFIIFSILRVHTVGYDSYYKILYGMQWANWGSLRQCIVDAAPFGLLEPIIHGMSNLYGVKLLYAIYQVVPLCGIGCMIAFSYYFVKKRISLAYIISLGSALLFLISNTDYLMNVSWALSNAIVGTFIFIIIGCVILYVECDIQSKWLMILSGIVIMVTRVEGACFLFLLLIMALAFDKYRTRMCSVNIILGIIIACWNVISFYLIGNNGEKYFWTPSKGILLVVVGVALVISGIITKSQKKILYYVLNNLTKIILCVIVLIIIIASFVFKSMAKSNFVVFISDFGAAAYANAGIWCFFFLLLPLLVFVGNKTIKNLNGFVICYILLEYAIFLFRTGVPIHTGIWCSARRMLTQIMPTAMWGISLLSGHLLQETQIASRIHKKS